MERFEDIEVYSIEMSADGTNAFYLPGCDIVEHCPPYAACLKKIADRKQGRLNTIFAECSAAIGKHNCKAMAMRDQEVKEGRALFFINRKKLQAHQAAIAEQQGVTLTQPARTPRHAPAMPKPAQERRSAPTVPAIDENAYAAAINAAIAEASTESVSAKPGMSMLELARLKLSKTQSQGVSHE